MGRFIDAVEAPQAPGIGGQQVVQTQQFSDAETVNTIGGLINTGIDIVGNNIAEERGREVVQSAQEDLDRALGHLQKHERENEILGLNENPSLFPTEPTIPESVSMSGAQFDMIRQAVRSGKMDRSRARLHVAKMVKERIAEEPMFADRIRKSAADFLGFDPQSEQTRQFFGAFADGPAQDENSFDRKLREEAATIASRTGVSQAFVEKQLMQNRLAEINKDHLDLQYDSGQISGRQYLDEQNRADSEQMFARTFGAVLEARQQGALMNAQEVEQLFEQDKMQHLAEITSGYHGNTTDPEFIRYREQVDARYADARSYIEEIGVDNMNEVELGRLETLLDLRAVQNFPEFIELRKAAGDAGFGQLMDMLGRTDSEESLQFMFSQFPVLETAWERLNQDDQQLRDQMYQAGRFYTTGEGSLDNIDEGVQDAMAQELMDTDDEQTQDSVVQGLAAQGYQMKPVSLLVGMSPTRASEGNKKFFRDSYEAELSERTASIGRELAEHLTTNPDMFTVDEHGDVTLNTGTAGRTPAGAPRTIRPSQEARDAAERLNMFNRGLSRGWGNVLGVTQQDHAKRVKDIVNNAVSEEQQSMRQEAEDMFLGGVERGTDSSIARGRRSYNKLREMFPDEYTAEFDDVIAEVDRLLGRPARPRPERREGPLIPINVHSGVPQRRGQ